MEIKATAALVSGGASGLGEATVRKLVAAGARVVIADRDATKGETLAKEIGDAVVFARTDVTEPEQVRSAVETAVGLGPLRIAVSCAGIGWASRTIGRDGSPHDLEPFRLVIHVNLFGTFNLLRIAASAIASTEPLDNGERGVVINTASVAAYDGQIGQIAYSASKAAVVGMTLPAARDLAAVGIRVVTIAPGLFDTPLLGLLPQPQKDALAENVVFPKRLGHVDDYASLVTEIVRNPYLNGETIRLDGGLRMPPK